MHVKFRLICLYGQNNLLEWDVRVFNILHALAVKAIILVTLTS